MAGLGNIFKVKQSPTMVTAMSQLDVTQKQWKHMSIQRLVHEFSCSIAYNSQNWKQPKCPSASKWINKLEYFSEIKRH
jgi:hypothetical protein